MMSTTLDQRVSAEDSSVESLTVAAYTVPTDSPESDGTFQWTSTTLVTVHIEASGQQGFGYTYAPAAAARLIVDVLSNVIQGSNVFDIESGWQAMVRAVRNAGRPGVSFCAISAADVALWDLKARLLGIPLISLWGAVRSSVPVYGSGGFTSYDDRRLTQQLGGWAAEGITRVKIKVGRDASDDPRRVAVARHAIGPDVNLFVDANGGYDRKQALRLAGVFADQSNVVWFEEPRPSDDLEGLRFVRERGPAGMEIAAGEYGYTPHYFRRMLEAGAVDCLQADATRCGGFTGFLKVAALAEAFCIPLSAHCAPQLHAHIGCCVAPLRHIEYFHDHARIAGMIIDEPLTPLNGKMQPDRARLGLGLTLKQPDARNFQVNY